MGGGGGGGYKRPARLPPPVCRRPSDPRLSGSAIKDTTTQLLDQPVPWSVVGGSHSFGYCPNSILRMTKERSRGARLGAFRRVVRAAWWLGPLAGRETGDRPTTARRRRKPRTPKKCLASGGHKRHQTRPWLGLADLSRIPGGTFFREVRGPPCLGNGVQTSKKPTARDLRYFFGGYGYVFY